MRHAVILAGGSGNRLWPASRRARAKQFLPLGARDNESLLAATSRRLADVCPVERVLVVTAAAQAQAVMEHVPALARDNLIAEPVARNTAAAVGLAAMYLLHRDADAVMAILPADHHIADEAEFARVATRAFAMAEAHDVIVTIGVVPGRPETGFGYLHVGERFAEHGHRVLRFVEKPDAGTARIYVESGDYLWNAGMFFVRARRIVAEIQAHLPATHAGLVEIAHALHAGGNNAAVAAVERVYPGLPAISIDHGVMEKARDVVTIRGDFGWNDVGSWPALAAYRQADQQGNITQGTVIAHDARSNIVIADTGVAVAVVGVNDLVVVQSGNSVLVVPRDRAQDVRAVVQALEERNLDKHL